MWLSYPKIKLILLGLLVIFSLVKISTLKIDYEVTQFFSKKDNEIIKYKEYVGDFGSDEQLLMVAIENRSGIFDIGFLNRVNSFSDSCKNISKVRKIVSLVNLKELVKTPFGLMPKSFLRFSDARKLTIDSLKIMQDEKWKGWLFSYDGKALIIFIETEKDLTNKEKTFVVNELKRNLKEFDFEATHLAGSLYTEVYYLKMTFFETAKSILTCSTVVIILIIMLFKSFKKIAVILATLFLGIILFYGFLGFINYPLNILSTLFPTLVVIVAISDLIHFMTKFEIEYQKQTNLKVALKTTLKEISVTLFITSLTTMIGLLALLTSQIVPIREFAILGAIGILIAFLLALFIFPILILVFKITESTSIKDASRWPTIVRKVYSIGKDKSTLILSIFIVVFIFSAIGISKLSLNGDLMGAIMNYSPLKKDFYYFEENLNGARALEIIVDIKYPFKISSLETLQEIEKLQKYLNAKKFIGPLISPVNSFKYMNTVYYPNLANNYNLPGDQKKADKYFRKIISLPQVINGELLNADKNRARMYGKMNDIGAVEMNRFITEIENWLVKNSNKNIVSFEFTGSALLIDKMNLSLVRSMGQSLIIAFVLVSLIMFILFKNVKYIVISLLPNIFPLIFVGGILGFFSIEITGAMSLIFTLGFVIAVDDTIHFLSKYKYELSKSSSSEQALKNTMFSTGKAIIITSLVLSLGYISIIISESRESFYHGLLISITLVAALISDLFLLPVLIRKFAKNDYTSR